MIASRWAWAEPPDPPRAPHVMLIAFGRGRLPVESSDDAVDVRLIARATDPAWFDGWRQGFLRTIAETDLGDLTALDGADHLCTITAAPSAPADLAYLEAAWAAARALAAAGAAVVLDVHAHTFHRAADLPPAGAPLDVRRELRVIFETTSDRDDGAHALHTRGLKKFGAPDLVALCSKPDANLVGAAITQLATDWATGLAPRRLIMSPSATWHLVADRDHLADLLQLNNPALVLVDEHGHHLLGAAARRPPPS